MMSDTALEFTLPDADATDALGRALARALPSAGERCAVLYLQGELGAGKTTCARSLLRALGVSGVVRSPTYTLIETYRIAELSCVHVDLYRVCGALEVEELGLRDMLRPNCLLAIEWPEKGGGAVPAADVELRLEYAPSGRTARLGARSALGQAWLTNLRIDTR